MPNVAFTHPSYDDLLDRWTKIRDCISGAEKIKKARERYLPQPNATDQSPENTERYEAYLTRAMFYNMTARTQAGLVGQVMVEDPKIELPNDIKILLDDIDGAGVKSQQQMTETLGKVVAYGRNGLMADFPHTDGKPTTKAQLKQAMVRPTIITWDAWDIINWRTITIGGQIKTALIVLAEKYVTGDDGFEEDLDDQWRVLRLDQQGLYVLEEWIRDPRKKDEFIIKPLNTAPIDVPIPALTSGHYRKAQYMPTNADGKRLDYVPFVFQGVTSNNATPDLPPMYDLADLNVAHYRNSADYEESCFMVGQPTLVLAGLTEDWVKNELKGSVQIGSRAAIPLPQGATGELLQAQPNTLPFEAMQHKERQAVALGARLVEMKSVQRTATEAGNDSAAEASILGSIANNVSAAYREAYWMAAQFVNTKVTRESIKCQLNTNFIATAMDPAARAQLMTEWMSGAITDEEYRAALRRARIAYLTDEEWKAKREEQALTKGIVAGNSLPPEDDDDEDAAA